MTGHALTRYCRSTADLLVIRSPFHRDDPGGHHIADRGSHGDLLPRQTVARSCAPRTMTTGHGAWCTQCWLTEPSSASVKPPWPRLPTTSRSAPPAASSRTCAALPSRTVELTLTGLAGSTVSLIAPPAPAPHAREIAVHHHPDRRERHPAVRHRVVPGNDRLDGGARQLGLPNCPGQRRLRRLRAIHTHDNPMLRLLCACSLMPVPPEVTPSGWRIQAGQSRGI